MIPVLSATQALQTSLYQHRAVVLARMKMSIRILRKLSSRKFPACFSHSSPTVIKNRSRPVVLLQRRESFPHQKDATFSSPAVRGVRCNLLIQTVLPVTPAAVAAPQSQCSAVLEELLVGGRGKKPKASISHCFFFSLSVCAI